MDNRVSKPPVALFPGWNIPSVSGVHFVTSMIDIAEKEIPFSHKEKEDVYASMLAPYERHEHCQNL